jgi:hypothetical protein
MQQGKLNGTFKAIKAPAEFTREGVLQAVVQFVACDNQVHSVHRTQQSSSADVRVDPPGTGSRK